MATGNFKICRSLAQLIVDLPSYDLYCSRPYKRESQRRQKHVLCDAGIILADEILPKSEKYECDELTGLLFGFKAKLREGISAKATNPGVHRDEMLEIWGQTASKAAELYNLRRRRLGIMNGTDPFPPMHGGWSIDGKYVESIVEDALPLVETMGWDTNLPRFRSRTS